MMADTKDSSPVFKEAIVIGLITFAIAVIGMPVVHIILRPFRRRTHEKVMVINEVRRRKLFIQVAAVEL